MVRMIASLCVFLMAGSLLSCKSSDTKQASPLKSAVLHALAESPDSLLGDYGVKVNQSVHPFLRITRSSGSTSGYALAENNNGTWVPQKIAGRPLTKEEFSKLVGMGIDVPFTGIVFGQAALIKVPAGWHQSNFSTSTGYLFLSILGPIELTKL